MAVRSRRLYSANLATIGSTVNIFTVPAGRTLIVRTVTFKRRTVNATDVEVLIRPAGGGGLSVWARAALATNETVALPFEIILNPTDVLAVFQTASCYVHAFGALLFGEPE